MGKACPLSTVEQQKIQQWTAAHGTPQQVGLRCRIVLAAAAGESDVTIANQLSVNRNTVILWRKRFGDEGLDGLWDIAPGRGRKPTYQIDKIAGIVDATLRTKPAGMTHWSCRTMAQSQGVSKSTVNNIWRDHNLQPHRTETFKLSRDPKFLEKMTDVIGLYLNPPQQAIVLCVDEKSQIQALDRTQPGLPIKKGRHGTMTHDYVRNGTTTLFAALNVLEGKVIGRCMQRHRHQEFIRFLNAVEAEVPAGKIVHIIVDNYATHKHPKVKAWLARHPRFVFHFTPTSCSWLNASCSVDSVTSMAESSRGCSPIAALPLGEREPLVALEDISKRYGRRSAVVELTLALRAGDICGCICANGGGKTTALRMVAGILRPDGGRGRVLGFALLRDAAAIRGRVGYLSQRSSLYAELSVFENLRFRAQIHGLTNPRAAADAAIEAFGLMPFARSPAGSLSGGWARRLQLAGSLLHSPRVVLLDEPTAGPRFAAPPTP